MKMYWEEISEYNWDNNNIESLSIPSLLTIRQEKNELPIIYFDMDGVLACWQNIKSVRFPDGLTMEEVFSKGYFSKLPPIMQFINLCKKLHELGYDVRIVSKAKYFAIEDKVEWLGKHLPFIPKEHMHFVPLDANKSDFVPEIKHTDIVIDDYNPNLYEWKGSSIKALNGQNSVNTDFPHIGIDKKFESNLSVITWTLLREFALDYKQGIVNKDLFSYIEDKSYISTVDFLSMCKGFGLSETDLKALTKIELANEKDDIEL